LAAFDGIVVVAFGGGIVRIGGIVSIVKAGRRVFERVIRRFRARIVKVEVCKNSWGGLAWNRVR
jgi:hypothetical protein